MSSIRLFVVALSVLVSVVNGAANALIQVTSFGANPSNVGFYLYVPTVLQTKPPILVNPHWCHGSAQAAFSGTQLATLADTHGYIMIFPDSPNTVDKCRDLSSNATLTHNGGGDSLGIISMVKYVLANYNADPNRVFVMGTSSGAMMTNLLIGTYPDIFAAGSAWAGVPYGCFADPAGGVDVWNSACALGTVVKTGAQWGALVNAAYPGYTGYRPKMQVFHGSVDTVVYPQNLQEEIKEWTTVLGLPSSPISTLTDSPNSGWITCVYGSTFTATSAVGVTHNIQTNAAVVLAWFDLTCSGTNCFSRTSSGSSSSVVSSARSTSTSTKSSSSSTKTLTTSSSTKSSSIVTSTKSISTSASSIKTSTKASSTVKNTTSTTTSSGAASTASAVAKYGKCGGVDYTGSTICIAGSVCTYYNDWFWQCV